MPPAPWRRCAVLQPGATFILEYANKQNIKSILRYRHQRQHWSPFTPEPVEFTALNFDFHPNTVRRWLRESGFAVERQLTVSHFRLGAFKRYLPLKLLVGMDFLAQLTGDWWQLTPSVFARCRATGETALAAPAHSSPARTASMPLSSKRRGTLLPRLLQRLGYPGWHLRFP